MVLVLGGELASAHELVDTTDPVSALRPFLTILELHSNGTDGRAVSGAFERLAPTESFQAFYPTVSASCPCSQAEAHQDPA